MRLTLWSSQILEKDSFEDKLSNLKCHSIGPLGRISTGASERGQIVLGKVAAGPEDAPPVTPNPSFTRTNCPDGAVA